ncbi:Ff.00g106250.m01.CDS01 [Fusarium sp. VM40]|nr:Ff.00g106250.m01.CDS01 [Fusarium sp. VM40]
MSSDLQGILLLPNARLSILLLLESIIRPVTTMLHDSDPGYSSSTTIGPSRRDYQYKHQQQFEITQPLTDIVLAIANQAHPSFHQKLLPSTERPNQVVLAANKARASPQSGGS